MRPKSSLCTLVVLATQLTLAVSSDSAVTGAASLRATRGVSPASPRSLSGVVHTGGTSSSQPLPAVNVTLFEATPALPTVVGQATTDASGRFTIPYKKSSSSSIFFVKADIGEGV